MFGWSATVLVATSTILVMAPYFLFSILAGRMADFWSKAKIIRGLKALEIGIFAMPGLGLLTMNLPVLMLALLMAGIQAALMGAAKFGILPEMLTPGELLRGNAWVNASGTVAIVVGLICGNLLVLDGSGIVLACCGGAVAVLGWLISLAIPAASQAPPEATWRWPDILLDYWQSVGWLRQRPELVVPMLGSSWFWFQGALCTALFPMFIALWTDQPESAFTILLVASALGVALGALSARPLSAALSVPAISITSFLSIAIPGLDLWLSAPLTGSLGLTRLALDVMVMAAGTGLFSVVLTTVIQALAPAAQRSRFIGVNHTMQGLALMGSGWAILLFNAADFSIPQIYTTLALLTAGVAALSLATSASGHRADAEGSTLLPL